MNTTITLSAEQISLLLQVLSKAWIEPREQNLADGVVKVLETADNKITRLY